MTATAGDTTRDLYAKIVPPAERQTAPDADGLLHSANAGVVVVKVGQVRSEYRNEARVFAREVAKHVNTRQQGNATAYVYEETFGTEDRLHFLIHLRALDSYYGMVEMGDQDRAYRESLQAERVQTEDGGKAWDRLYVDGSIRSTVMLPAAPADAGLTLHSGNAGIVIHRTAQVRYGEGERARLLARGFAETVNARLAGEATAVAYEEAFGACRRLHWLLHLRDLTSYSRLLEVEDVEGDAHGVPVEGSMSEVALTPHHWGLYGTGGG